jgi:hypothetical protein
MSEMTQREFNGMPLMLNVPHLQKWTKRIIQTVVNAKQTKNKSPIIYAIS